VTARIARQLSVLGARAFLLAALATLAGCGSVVRVAYNNGDLALRMVANDYLDLESEQVELFKARFARLHEWHRREELPRYALALESAAQRVARGVSDDDVAWAIDTVRARYRALAARAIDESLPLLATLKPGNLAALDRKLESGNRKYVSEYLSADGAANEKARSDAIAGRFEDWLGHVSAEQRRLIAAFVHAQPQHLALRFEDRKARQRDFVQALRERGDPVRLRERLRGLFLDFESRRTREYARSSAEWQERLTGLIVGIAGMATREQRDYAAARLMRYAADFRELAAEGGAPGTRAALATGGDG
jgi:hypothetical protein